MIYEVKDIELDYSKIDVAAPQKSPYKPYLKVFVPNLEEKLVLLLMGVLPQQEQH